MHIERARHINGDSYGQKNIFIIVISLSWSWATC